MEKILIFYLKKNKNEINRRLKERLKNERPELFKDDLQEEITNTLLRNLNKIVQKYIENQESIYQVTEPLSQLNQSAKLLFLIIDYYEKAINDVLIHDISKTTDEKGLLLLATGSLKSDLLMSLTDSYEKKYNTVIAMQKKVLEQLSTPILPAFDRILIVPLIGTVDAERAKRVMENLLNGVVEYKSEIILIDITGVPIVDSEVAHHVVRMVEAIHIVGGESMLVGIRPEIAQMFVSLKVELGNMMIYGTLQEGIKKALERTNRRISEVK